jgi:hypothetical protein
VLPQTTSRISHFALKSPVPINKSINHYEKSFYRVATALCSAETKLCLSSKTQPNLITIFQEDVKVGRGSEHAKHESGFPAAYEKAKSPYYYLAMTSVTGQSQAWYISPWESHAAIGDSMKREDSDPFLSAELARLGRRTLNCINSFRSLEAARTDELRRVSRSEQNP